MKYITLEPDKLPIELLLEGDPSFEKITNYLVDSLCFAAILEQQIAGACVAKKLSPKHAEIFNISVSPEHQQRGIGSGLLRFVLTELSQKQVVRVELNTGTFGYQLAYYQRAGFRVDSLLKDHFTKNYAEPIFENGMQHQDSLRLYLELTSQA